MKNILKKISSSPTLAVLTIIALGFFVYSFSLSAPFKTLDDQSSIVNNIQIKSLKNVGKIFTGSFFGSKHYYRPIVSLSFMIDYYLWGQNPFFFNLTNLVIHLLASITVFFLLKKFLENDLLAFLAALLFTIHPIHWEAVSNIPGRAILLCGLFVLNSFNFFLLYESNKGKKIFYILSLICFVLSLFSKESGVMLPIVLLSYLWIVKKEKLKNLFSFANPVLPYFGTIFIYIIFRKILRIVNVFAWQSLGDQLLGSATFLRSLLTFLRLFILPLDMHFDRSRPLIKGITDPELWLTGLIYFISIFIIIKFWKKFKRKEIFFAVWFLIELFPVSQTFASVGAYPGFISTAEHFLYVPSVGIFALIVIIGEKVFKLNKKSKILSEPIAATIAVLIYIFFILTTIQQNVYSSQEASMFKRTLHYAPYNIRIRNSLALGLAKKGLYNDAEYHFRKALEFDPYNVRARIGLGKALCDQGKYLEGIHEYEKIKDAGELKDVLDKNLELTYKIVVDKYKEKIKDDKTNPDLYYVLGIMYSKLGQVNKAIKQYESAVNLDPNNKDALFNLGSSYEVLGEFGKAIVFYERALTIEGGDPWIDKTAAEHLSVIYKHVGKL